MNDPKVTAQKTFARPEQLVQGIEVITRFATDPPVTVQTVLDAITPFASPGSRVIELGFGSGWLLDELPAACPQASIYGLDLSPGNTRRAQDLHGDEVRILTGDIERLPFCDDSFSVVVSCWTLYFMRDIDAALEEIKRCLRANGHLIAATSAPDHEHELGALVAEAVLSATKAAPEEDIGRRFDLETGEAFMRRHFPRVDVQEWRGEMVLPELAYVLALWSKWAPKSLSAEAEAQAFAAFERLAADRLARDGALRISRHECAFIGDLTER